MMDFTRAFTKRRFRRLDFRSRTDANYFHDIIFLSSYLHDARFKTADLSRKKGRMTIHFDRICWEYTTRVHEVRANTLFGCRSVLTIDGIQSAHWNRKHPPEELEVTSVHVGSKQFKSDKAHLVFHSAGQKVQLELLGKDYFLTIGLKDVEDPR